MAEVAVEIVDFKDADQHRYIELVRKYQYSKTLMMSSDSSLILYITNDMCSRCAVESKHTRS